MSSSGQLNEMQFPEALRAQVGGKPDYFIGRVGSFEVVRHQSVAPENHSVYVWASVMGVLVVQNGELVWKDQLAI